MSSCDTILGLVQIHCMLLASIGVMRKSQRLQYCKLQGGFLLYTYYCGLTYTSFWENSRKSEILILTALSKHAMGLIITDFIDGK